MAGHNESGGDQMISYRRSGTAVAAVLSAAALLAGAAAATGQPEPAQRGAAQAVALEPPDLGLADSEIVVVHKNTTPCHQGTATFGVDSPVRLYEDDNHLVHMTNSTATGVGYQWFGTPASFTKSTPTTVLSCTPIMRSFVLDPDEDPAEFDQKTFIQGLYHDSPNLYLYGHQDYYARRIPLADCAPAVPENECWYSSVAVWKAKATTASGAVTASRDGAPPDHIAIYPHVRYPGHQATPSDGWIGYGTPTNIFRGRDALGGYYYLYVRSSAEGYQGQDRGSCLFRNDDPADKTGWRAYDVETGGFTQQMVNPYVGVNQPCDVISTLGTGYQRSVVWHQPSRHYIALSRTGTQVVYRTSTDLVEWSEPQLLLVSESWQAEYPSFADFDGGDYGDDNFDRLYDNGKTFIYYRKKASDDPSVSAHSLVRRRIHVENYPADPPGPDNAG